MSMDHTTMRNELALQKAIRLQLDPIVQLAMRTIVQGVDPEKVKEKNQLRNVVNVATNAGSVEVVTNFIRYQISRDKPDGVWRGKDLGHKVIAIIEDDIKKLAHHVITILPPEMWQSRDKKEVTRWVHQELTELYAGYLNRCFYYVVEMKSVRGLPVSKEDTNAG